MRRIVIKRVAVIVLCCASLSWAKQCWTNTPEGVRQEIACDDSANWRSDEKAPHHPQPAWETGEVKALFLPSQTWDSKTGGTEIADQIKYAKQHAIVQPVAEAGAGKPAGFK